MQEAKEILRRAVPDVDVYFEKGQIEIIPYSHGYVNEGASDSSTSPTGSRNHLGIVKK